MSRALESDNERAHEALLLDLPFGRLEARKTRYPRPPGLGLAVSGDVPEIEFLVSTSGYGVLRYEDGRLGAIGSSPWAYGLTTVGDRWVAFERTGRRGRLVALDLSRKTRNRCLIWGLPPRVHQIDGSEGVLYLTDPYNNRILGTLPGPATGFWRSAVRRHFPAGPALRGRRSDNYMHFNSIFPYGNELYVVAHNDYVNSGRTSQVWILDHELNKREECDLGSANCHNYYTDGTNELYLASRSGQVVWNGAPVLDTEYYLRGLSVAEDYLIIGGSDSFARPDRAKGVGRILVLDRQLSIVAEIHIPGTQIHEIRRLDRKELAMGGAG